MDNCTDNCEVSKSLRRDVDDLKISIVEVVKDIGELKQTNAGKEVEINNLTSVLNKVDGTVNMVLEKLNELSLKIATLDFYTRQEVDDKVKCATIKVIEDVERIKEEPAKDYKTIKMVVITSVISTLVGALVAVTIKML